VRITNTTVERASCASEGRFSLADHAPMPGPINPPAGSRVVAASARRPAGALRRQGKGAANTSLKITTNPRIDKTSRTPAVTIQSPHPSTSLAGTPASAGRARKAIATATARSTPHRVHECERRRAAAAWLTRSVQ
jgi:hypothetical protein